MNNYILTNSACNDCIFGKNGHYNAVCAHCPYCIYSKGEVRFMTKEIAEELGIVNSEETK